MKNSFRITKYHCYGDDGSLCSQKSDWTSFFDVGSKVSLDEYLFVEEQYVNFVVALCARVGVCEIMINALEISDGCSYNNGQMIDIASVATLVADVLRERFWCKLVSDKVEFHFGYDFYMYAVCPLGLLEIKELVPASLNVELFKSPYL